MKSLLEAMNILKENNKVNKYDFSNKENIKKFIIELPYKEVLKLYREFTPGGRSEGAGRGSKRQFLLDMVENGFKYNPNEIMNYLFHYFLYNSPYIIYHFTTIDKYIEIKKDNLLKVNNENLICCTGKEDLMNFNTNGNIVRMQITTTSLPGFEIVRRRDKSDSQNVEFEDEWVIDFSNSSRKGLRLDTLNLFKIEFSPDLENDTEINKMLKDKLKEVE